MSSRIKFLLVISLLCAGGMGGYAMGAYLSASVENDPVLNSCPLLMADIIQSAKGDVYKIDDPNYLEPKSYDLVTYSVNGDEITNPVFDTTPNDLKNEQQDRVLQEQAWHLFTALIPAKDRRMVAQYLIFTDGREETLAAVDQMPDDLTRWIFEVDVADLDDRDAFLFTLIHEYGHLLTLNDSQVSIDAEIHNDPGNISLIESKAAACPDYFEGSGCSLSNSYINAFHKRFWVDINAEWEKINALQYAEDLSPYYEGLYNFYKTHQDQFLDDYSTTHPVEDIAEAWAFFVLSPKPGRTSIASEKILFFYEFPELVDLRGQILNQLCIEFPQ